MATSGTKIVVEIGGNINVTSENVKKNVNISEEKEKKQKKQQEKTERQEIAHTYSMENYS